jgi:NADH-quinone oxidoreductase subunit H
MTLSPGIVLPALFQVANPQLPPGTGVFLIATVVKIIVFFTVYLVSVAMLTLAERKVSAWIQDRRGPNRAGPGGLLQPLADGVKNFMKEENAPPHATGAIFNIAPGISFVTALTVWGVIPFGAPLPTPWGLIDMQVADIPMGYLFLVAVASLGAYGLVLAGWSSNNKYAFLGGLRASAQMVSYEIGLGLSIIPVLMLAGNVTLDSVIAQQQAGWWNVLNLSVAFITFLISAFAETNRLPFDMPEAEAELVAGYHTEYSSMKFSMFFIAEYAAMITMSAFMATLFFGGWDIPFVSWDNTPPWTVLKTLLTTLAFSLKTLFFLFFYMWVRWTLPRFRYDQLMALGWRVLIPVTLGYVVILAMVLLLLQMLGVTGWLHSAALFGMNAVLVFLLVFVLDRGRIVGPTRPRVEIRRPGQVLAAGEGGD